MNKSELLNWLREEYRGWESLLEQIGPERMEQPGVNGNWAMKDIVAHLTGWNRRLVAHIGAAARREPEPPPPWPAHLQTDDEVNAWIYESYRGRSLREVLDESRQIFQQIFTVVENLPDNFRIEVVQHDRAYYLVWLGEERYQPGEFFDHFHDDHEPDVRAWLARRENNGGFR
jgi:hypothetical protein